ncbi:MAG: hypothetical protein VW455_07930, partial [Nitrospinota bacterium]
MVINYRNLIKYSFALALAILISGCAALTLDVDVYKGSLVNDEAILTEQTAVMATGAKPLLIKLRDKLERSELENYKEVCYQRTHTNPDKDLIEQFEYTLHIPGHGATEKGYNFCSEEAKTINDILSLYDDKQIIDPQFDGLIQKTWRLLSDLDKAGAILEPNSEQQHKDKKIWEQLEKSLKEEIKETWKCQEKNPSEEKKCSNIKDAKLAYGYKLFLTATGKENNKKYIRPINGIFNEDYNNDFNETIKTEEELKNSTNYKFRYLAQTEPSNPNSVLKKNAERIFKKDAEKAKTLFYFKTRQIAQSFLDIRNTLEELLRVSQTIIMQLDTLNETSKKKYLEMVV